MSRLGAVLVLGVVLTMSSSAWAQRGPGGGFPGKGFGPGGGKEPGAPSGEADVEKLEAELAKLKGMIREVESKLRNAKESAPAPREARKDERRSNPPESRKDQRRPTPPEAEVDDRRPQGPSGFTPPSFGRGPWGYGPPSGGMPWGRGMESRDSKGPPMGGSAVEKRLDTIEKDLEEIKRLLRSKR